MPNQPGLKSYDYDYDLIKLIYKGVFFAEASQVSSSFFNIQVYICAQFNQMLKSTGYQKTV